MGIDTSELMSVANKIMQLDDNTYFRITEFLTGCADHEFELNITDVYNELWSGKANNDSAGAQIFMREVKRIIG